MRNSSTSSSSRTFEGLLLAVLLSFGIYGIFFYFNSSEDKGVDLSAFSQQNTYEQLQVKVKDQVPTAELPPLNDENSVLAIKGLAEVGNIMSFSIQNFNEDTNYVLDFGNGNKKKVKGGTAKYIYKTSGDYEVKLITSYNGSTKVVQSEKLTINENMALVMN